MFFRPNTGLSHMDEEKADLMQRYIPVNREKAGIKHFLARVKWISVLKLINIAVRKFPSLLIAWKQINSF